MKPTQLLARVLVVALVVVAAAVADGGEDVDRLLALAHAAAELEPAAEAGDVGGARALERDQERVAERVAVEARAHEAGAGLVWGLLVALATLAKPVPVHPPAPLVAASTPEIA